MTGIGKDSDPDGRLDKGPPISGEAYMALAQKEEAEMKKVARDLGESEEEEEISQGEAPGLSTSYAEERTTPRQKQIRINPDPISTPPSKSRKNPGRPRGESPRPQTRESSGSTQDISPSIWFGVLTLEGTRAICQSEEDLLALQEEGAEFETFFPTETEARAWLSAESQPLPRTAKVWYGIREPGGTKALCTSKEDLDTLLMDEQGRLERVFKEESSATEWLLSSSKQSSPTSTILRAERLPQGPPVKARRPPSRSIVQNSRPAGSHTGPSSKTPFRAAAMGTDPSTGDRDKIYNMVTTDSEVLDESLCPPDLSHQDRDLLFEQVIDVAALPGTYRKGDSEGDTGVSADMEMFAQVAMRSWGGGRGGGSSNASNLTWASPSKNALDKVKTLDDVESYIRRISSVRERLFTGQSQRLGRFLHKRRYLHTEIDDFLDNGLLPLLVRRTFEYYMELLATVRLEAYQCVFGWDGSLAKAMVTYHSEKLGEIRAYAADWRDCFLGTYVHLRDAHKKGFFSERMTRALWRQGPLLGGVSPTKLSGEKQAEEFESPTGSRCNHCRRLNIHDGTTKSECTLSDFSATSARALLKGFNDRVAKQVAREGAVALSAAKTKDADTDPSAVVQTVRAKHGK